MQDGRVDILMYHSISENPGPTNIAPDIFAKQIEVIAHVGVPVITLDTLVQARQTGAPLPPHSVVITFDDGFQDFADTAWPILERHGFQAINYLPTRYIGEYDVWEGSDAPRPIMTWATIKTLVGAGALFGSHTISHPNLTTLNAVDLAQELSASRIMIEDKLGCDIPHFAPPFGAVNARVRAQIAKHYDSSVGTHLYSAGPSSALLDLPRIEMFYFTDIARWERFLSGNDGYYLPLRRALRQVGKLRRLVG